MTALQLFRDLFASEALRPGEEFSVGSQAVVFTDLRDSTKLYREIGDAVAFGRVRCAESRDSSRRRRRRQNHYFGSAINLTARLESQSSGSDVIISTPVRHDPEVVEWLRQQTRLLVEPVETTLKGF